MAADPTDAPPDLALPPDLDAPQAVPGGGPAPRRRAARITSRAFWTWAASTAFALALLGAVVLAVVTGGGISRVGIVLVLATSGALGLSIAAGVAIAPAALASRVDDDMTTYAWGTEAVLRAGSGYAGEATVEVRGRTVARVPAPELAGRRRLVVGTEELTLVRRSARIQLRDPEGVQAEVLRHENDLGSLVDHEFVVDGRRLRLRQRVGAAVPRATLLDDRGRAWAVTHGRDRVAARLPDEIHEGGAAFCLVVLASLTGVIGPVAEETEPVKAGRGRRRSGTRRRA